MVAAIVIFDLALRPFDNGTITGTVTTERQYAEGMSVIHRQNNDPAPYSWRLTGKTPIEGATEVLIVGDSYVAARQVRDDQTMGALLERRSRAAGNNINVRQYGISGGSAPAYAAAATALIARWNPAWVIVVMPTNDLTDEALNRAPRWRLRIRDGDSAEVYAVAPSRERPSIFGAAIDYLASNTTLGNVLMHRWSQLRTPRRQPLPRGTTSVEDPRLPRVPQASVSLLARAYGKRLLIMHLPEVSMRFSQKITPQEVRLESACRAAGVPFISARDVLIRARNHFVLARGFENTVPGEGHLNPIGHQLVAGVLWQLLDSAQRGADRMK